MRTSHKSSRGSKSSFFFNATATTEIYTLSLHDALPIFRRLRRRGALAVAVAADRGRSQGQALRIDRKSTRLNSSHVSISYAVFCLKKKQGINPVQISRSTYLSL